MPGDQERTYFISVKLSKFEETNAYDVNVSDKIFIVLLKEMYLKTFIQTKNTLIAKIMFWYSDHSPRSVKSPKASGSAKRGCKTLIS